MASDHSTPDAAFGHWLSGFCAGEASFNLVYNRQPCSSFCLKLRADELPILETIRDFLGCGSLTVQPPRKGVPCSIAVLMVGGVYDLVDKIVPHFRHFPLRGRKTDDFDVWEEAVLLHHRVSQRTFASRGHNLGMFPKWTEGDVAAYKALAVRLHEGRQFRERQTASEAFPFDEACLHWLAGLIAAEGCLQLRLRNAGKSGAARLAVRLRADDAAVVHAIAHHFDVKNVTREQYGPSKPTLCVEVTRLDTLIHRVIPFLEHFPLRARKAFEVPVWIEGVRFAFVLNQQPVKFHVCLDGKPQGRVRRWTNSHLAHFLSLRNALRPTGKDK